MILKLISFQGVVTSRPEVCKTVVQEVTEDVSLLSQDSIESLKESSQSDIDPGSRFWVLKFSSLDFFKKVFRGKYGDCLANDL